MRNKILSALVIAVYLMQAVATIEVHAAPLLLQVDPSLVDLIKNTNSVPDETTGELVYVNISASDHSADVITRSVTGENTLKANTLATITTKCPNEVDTNTTSDCPSAAVIVVVKNWDTVERKLYACTYITQADDTWITYGRFEAHNAFNSVGPYMPLPYAKCQTYTVAAGASKAVSMKVDGGTGTEGELRTWYVRTAFSWSEINTCDQPFVVLTTDTYPINVQVMNPVTQSAPDQVYDVTPGQYYRVSTSGTYYSANYTNEYYYDEVHVSWDNVTWVNIEKYTSECFESEGDRTGWYLLAESDKFYIRTGDGLPGDTTIGGYNNDDHIATGTTFEYTIELGVPPENPTCESQYTYDSETDSVGSVSVPATNSNGVKANSEQLVLGDWYVVRWVSGSWQDGGGAARVDVEYSFYGSGEGYTDLSGGSGGAEGGVANGAVWCVSSTGIEVLIQASADNLYLRVNDQNSNFGDNTGTTYYDLFHATFTRTPVSCETTMQVGDLIEHKTVDGDQSGGLPFAQMVGGAIGSIGLAPGAWYILETTEGPWWQGALNPFYRYDMAVSEDGSTWEPLEDWDVPTCNVETDTLGHRRIIFQMPDAGEITYSLRVDASGSFFINFGSMSWDLYGATQLQVTPGPGGCDYAYDEETVISYGSFDGSDINGALLSGLTAGNIYAIKILPDTTYLPVKEGWQESLLAEYNQNTVQISHNDGHQFFSVPEEYTAMLCYETIDPVGDSALDGQLLFVQPGDNYSYKLRVDSETFSNNTGSMLYWVYGATAGQTIDNTCFSGLSFQSINEFDWLDVRDEAGEILSADTARYEEFIALVPGRQYAVETPVGQGPWTTDGEDHYDVAITNDNGVTWEEISMDSTMIDCADRELIGHVWKAKFTMEEGQVWKLRVNDTAGAFADNGGNMAYKFYVLCEGMACTGSVPDDSNNIPAISIQGGGNVCNIPVMRPGALTAGELFNVGTYLGSWVQYVNLSVLRYMAWCPKHTSAFIAFLNKFKTVEPLATVIEWQDNLNAIKSEINAYDWGSGSGQDFSLFDVHSKSELTAIVNERVFPSGGGSVWDHGELISFGEGTGLPDAYYSCSSALTARLPDSLKTGVCFVSAYFIETSASFWIQIVLDIGAFFMIIGMLKGALQETIYMMTGVKPWTKSGLNSSVDKLAAYMERRDRDDDIASEMSRRFGGTFRRDSDGSYRR